MLDDETKWQTIHNGFHASVAEKKPIDPIIIPGFFIQHTVRVFCTSLSAKSTWWKAGRLIHLLGSTPGPDFVASRHLVGLKERTLIILPLVTPEYRLKFIPEKWLQEIALVIEIYIE
jgi:hypothetical protein